MRSPAAPLALLLVAAGVALAPNAAPAAKVSAVRTVTATATVIQAVSTTTTLRLSSGAMKTHGNAPTGRVVVPATFPTLMTPAPTYIDAMATNGAHAVAPNAAQITITGAPGQAFTLHFQTWTLVSGQAGSTASIAANTFYAPGNSPSNVPSGVLNAQGKATVYIGSTITVPRNDPGTTVIFSPAYTVTYN